MNRCQEVMIDLSHLDVCFVAGTLGLGGAERQLYYLLRALKCHDAQVRLVSLTRGEFWEGPIRELGVPVTTLDGARSRLGRLFGLVRYLRRKPPHVLQSQHFFTNSYVAAAGALLRLPTVGAVRNSLSEAMKAYGPLLGSLSLRTPRFLAVNSQVSIAAARGLGIAPTRLYFLPNVVDSTRFFPDGRCAPETVRILTVGRLSRQKRIDRFLDVLSCTRKRTTIPFRARIVGSGPLRAQLEEKARGHGLGPETVQFTGALSNVAEIYRRTDLFVLTSDWEGTPNVVLEAMASALPVVATAVGGVPEVVRHGQTGYLSPPSALDAMVSNLVRLVENEALRKRLGANGRDYVVADHSAEVLNHHLSKLFAGVLQQSVSGV